MKSLFKFISLYTIIIPIITLISSAQNNDSAIRIGMSAAFSGQSSEIGNSLYEGAKSYFDVVNQAGGIDGKRIELIKYDDGYNPIPALENTLKLIKIDKVLLLFSYVGTPTVTRVLPLLKLYGDQDYFLFFPLTGAQPQREPPYNRYVYNFRASYRDETAGLVDNFVLVGRKRIAVFYQADAYGRSGWDGVNRALQKYNLSIVSEATYKRGTKYGEDFTRHVNILKKQSPDVIISIGSYQACAGLIRDIRNNNWKIPVANLSFVNSESMLKLLLKESSKTGVDYSENIVNSEIVPNYNDTSLDIVKEYRKYDSNYNFTSFEGFINAKLLVEILRRMDDNINRPNLKKTTESIRDLDLGFGETISFSPGNNQASDLVYYNRVKNGKWIPIDSWNRWKK